MPPDPADFATWLAANPPPNLQALVSRHGGYSNVPREAWEQWDYDCTAWEAARKDRLFGSHTWDIAQPKRRK